VNEGFKECSSVMIVGKYPEGFGANAANEKFKVFCFSKGHAIK
jgi:hypothetical protein